MDKMGVTPLFDGFYSGRRVMITGHTGFKGSWLSIILRWLGADVYGYALDPPTSPSLYNTADIDELVTSTIGDIRDFNKLLNCLLETKPEIIIHMAAQPLVMESYRNPRETYETNVMGTVNILEASRQVDSLKVILNITTDKCYENKEWIWGYRENEPMGGYDPYSNSKSCSELVTSSFRNAFFNPNEYSKHGVALASARAGNVIGGGDWAEDRLIPDFFRSILKGETLKIRSPHAIRPWQHVLEPLNGYLTLCHRLYDTGPSFAEGWNFGPDDSDAKNVEWISNRICELWGDEVKYEINKDFQLHEANYLKLDCSKARNILKWHPKWNIETAIQKIVDWNKAYFADSDMNLICVNQIEEYFNESKSI